MESNEGLEEGAPGRRRIIEEIVRQLSEMGLDLPSNLEESSELRGDLGLTSLDAVDLVLALEETYEIELEDDDIADFQTLGDVLDAVERYRAPNASTRRSSAEEP